MQQLRRLGQTEFMGTLHRRGDFAAGCVQLIGHDPDIDPHEHEHAHFVWVMAGHYHTNARSAEGAVGAGAVLYISPGTRHRDAFNAPGKLSAFAPSDALMRIFGPAPDTGARVMKSGAGALMSAIAEEAWRADALSAIALEALALELLAYARDGVDVGKRPPWFDRACERLRESCEEEPSLAALAAEAGVHPVHFARAFRRFVGATPGDYQRRQRAIRAAALLARTTTPLSEVALACGFGDQAAFTKSFGRVAGLAPGAFRRRWREV